MRGKLQAGWKCWMVGGILISCSKLSCGGEHEGGCCVDVGGRGRWQIGRDGEWNSGGREIVRMINK